MKYKLITLLAICLISGSLSAQEIKLTKASGKIVVNLYNVKIEGYDGKEIIISGQKVQQDETDERAKGLVPVSSSKYSDNTGLGLSVVDNGTTVEVNAVSREPLGHIAIKVPRQLKVTVGNNMTTSFFYAFSTTNDKGEKNGSNDDILITNMKDEIEVSVSKNKVRLENNTGPISVKTVTGPIEAVFSGEIKGPISMISAMSYVDVALPTTAKVNLEMASSYGKLYAAKEFQIEREESISPETRAIKTEGLASLSGTNINVKDRKSASSASGSISVQAKTANQSGIQLTDSIKSTNKIVIDGLAISSSNGVNVVSPSRLATTINGITNNDIARYGIGTDGTRVYDLRYSVGEKIKGKVNGGGVDIILKSTNKNVYLRQQ